MPADETGHFAAARGVADTDGVPQVELTDKIGEIARVAAELYADYNIVGLAAGDTGVQMGGWFRREVRSLADLQGLTFRVSGYAGNMFQRMGASPIEIAPAAIYPALERGAIDAAEFIGPEHELYEDTAAKDARFRRIYEGWRAYRDEQYQWFRVAEHTYGSLAFAAAASR